MKRILIVEDEASQAEDYISVFKASGWHVTWVDNLASVAAAIGNADVILADRGLPDGDGLIIPGLVQQMESDAAVIMLTAVNTQDERLRGLTQGAVDYVGKGVDPREVLIRCEAQLRNVMRNRREPTGILHVGLADAPADERLVISLSDRLTARQSIFRDLSTKLDRQRYRLEPTAFAILRRLAATPDQIVAVSEIEGSFFHRTEHTRQGVRNAISKIRRCIDNGFTNTFLHTYLPQDRDDEPGYYLRQVPVDPNSDFSKPARP